MSKEPKRHLQAEPPPIEDPQLLPRAISEALSRWDTETDVAPALNALLEALLDMTGADSGAVYELTEGGGNPVLVSRSIVGGAGQDRPRRHINEPLVTDNLDTLIGQVAKTGAPVFWRDSASPGSSAVASIPADIASFMGLPLYAAGRLLGVAGLTGHGECDEQMLSETVDPVLRTCAMLIHAARRAQGQAVPAAGPRPAHPDTDAPASRQAAALAMANERLSAQLAEHAHLEDRLRRQQAALLTLARCGHTQADLRPTLHNITETAAQILEVDRVSLWLYEDNGRALHCIDMFEQGSRRHSHGERRHAQQYPGYFASLGEQRAIDASDAHHDRRTHELSEPYLTPVNTSSLLDAPIWRSGEMVGVVCHEHTGPPRVWTQDEQNFAGSIADMVTLALEQADREHVQLSLDDSEERFRQVTDNIREVFWLTEPDKAKMVYISPAYEDIWGHSCASLYENPTSFLDVIHPDDRERIQLAVGQQANGDYDEVYRIIRPDGSQRWIRDRAFPVRDATGRIFRIAGIAEDITDQWQAESQMRKLSNAMDQAADSVLITDRGGVIEYVNAAFENTTGFTRTEAIGNTPNLVKSGRHGREFYRKLWDTINSGNAFSSVFVNRRKDGTLYYEEKSINPLKDKDGHITNFISTGKDITKRMRTEERLHYLAYHDVLTELPNRAMFLDRLGHAISQRRESDNCLAVLFLDLDRFKNINDSLGHDVGDKLLQALPGRIAPLLRASDTLARFGGDEFALLLEDIHSANDVSHVAQRVIEAFLRPFIVDGYELFVTPSVGIGLYPDDTTDAGTLLKYADTAMYRAKERGRSNYQFYSDEMGARAFEHLTLETHLRRALEREEYRLVYQPQIEVATGRIMGFEALIRWDHPELGLVSPMKFIPLLEETGMIVAVGRWVLEAACAQAGAWQRTTAMPIRIAVNLSGRQLFDHTLHGLVAELIERHGLEPGRLELEITESVLTQNDQITQENLNAFEHLPVRLSIDDFGTGFSSLANLKRFPVDTIKIDRSFIAELPGNSEDAAIVSATIAMAKTLDIDIVAEGVENENQLDFLRTLDCDAIQGYMVSKPLPPAAAESLLLEGIATAGRDT